MKTLHIVRHGKALQDYRFIQDFDRPLIEKGIMNNEAMAKQLLTRYSVPDLIFSSHAARALQTAYIFARVMVYPYDRIQINERLYLDGEKETYRILESLPDEVQSVMIVGHNPDVTFVANTYAGRGIEPIPTSGVVTINFTTNRWREIGKSNATVKRINKTLCESLFF